MACEIDGDEVIELLRIIADDLESGKSILARPVSYEVLHIEGSKDGYKDYAGVFNQLTLTTTQLFRDNSEERWEEIARVAKSRADDIRKWKAELANG